MGNEHTHYTVHCHRHTSHNIYSGYSRSDYNYYRNSSGHCSICRDEENRENERRARDRALKRQKKEADDLEAEQRRQRLKAERELREKREREKKRLIAERQQAERERAEKVKKMKEKLQRDLEAERERVRAAKAKKPQQPPENKNVYEKWNKLDTFEIVKDIGDRVKICSAAGQDIIDNVENIENELKKSLKDHYDTVEPEIVRYKKYGQEMRDMNKVFVTEFNKTLQSEYVSEVKETATAIDDQMQNKQENEQKMKDLLESTGSMESKLAQFMRLQANYNLTKKTFVDKIEAKLNGLQKTIENMESKLDVMSGYYDDMVADHDKFIAFCIDQGDKYGEEMNQMKKYLEDIGAGIKGKKRDLYEGQAEDVERKTFSEDYDHYTVHRTTNKIDNPNKDKNAVIGSLIGMAVGAAAGGIIAGAATCGVGATFGIMYGGAVGGAVGGCIIGSILDEVTGNDKDLFETKTTVTKSTKTVTLSNDDYYDGDKQNAALQEIINAMKPEITKITNKLQQAVDNAKQQKTETVSFKENISGIHEKITTFKDDINGIKDSLKNAKIDEEFQKNMETKCLDLFENVQKLIMGLEHSSGTKSKWKDNGDDDAKQSK